MPTATATDRPPAPTMTLPVGSAASVSTGETATAGANPGETPSASSSEAVQAALTTAEMLTASNTNKAVNLQFSVAGADLSLRVQLLNGQVHATFSTDSTQLRSALSNEWQSMSSSSGANVHLAEPVFTASGGGSFLSGDGASRQGGRQAAEEFAAALPASLSSLRPGAGPAAAAPAATASAPVAVASSLHLQTFA